MQLRRNTDPEGLGLSYPQRQQQGQEVKFSHMQRVGCTPNILKNLFDLLQRHPQPGTAHLVQRRLVSHKMKYHMLMMQRFPRL